MAIACPVNLDMLKLRAEIQSIYARVAEARRYGVIGVKLSAIRGRGR